MELGKDPKKNIATSEDDLELSAQEANNIGLAPCGFGIPETGNPALGYMASALASQLAHFRIASPPPRQAPRWPFQRTPLYHHLRPSISASVDRELADLREAGAEADFVSAAFGVRGVTPGVAGFFMAGMGIWTEFAFRAPAMILNQFSSAALVT
ncbi:hypothetical protein BDK51DRAFT_33214 [Blyttiomyces helicus]|uniref:Uncharacterized protein n=1 Tax=Blyttiomyces helicus TaxID=388810 RepID=A0A4P9VWH3_9FUNG|nr:hypothetical protein BDK51DRAFT_33214 [Blyttiomyces helicus]|eukprot:RKO84051.1 hypothetical protein BDK51DRAFT_33214 [Blyttiomyces helicus]